MHHFARGLFKPGGRFPALGPVLSPSTRPPHPRRARDLQHRAGDRPQFLQLKVLHPLPSFPHATSQTLLAKFKQQHEDNRYFLGTPVMEPAFIIQHFAGKVKYQIKVRSHPLPSSVKSRSAREAGRGPRGYPGGPFPLALAPSLLFIAFAGRGSRALGPSVKPLALLSRAPRAGTTSLLLRCTAH